MKILRFLGVLVAFFGLSFGAAHAVGCDYNEYGDRSDSSCNTCPTSYPYSLDDYNTYQGQCFKKCSNLCTQYDWSNFFPTGADRTVTLFDTTTPSYQIEFKMLTGEICGSTQNQYCAYRVMCAGNGTGGTQAYACKPGHKTVTFKDQNSTTIGTLWVVHQSVWSTHPTNNDEKYSNVFYPIFQTPDAPTVSNKKFIGWYDSATGGNLVIGPASNGVSYGTLNFSNAYSMTADTILYAHYEDVYTVQVQCSATANPQSFNTYSAGDTFTINGIETDIVKLCPSLCGDGEAQNGWDVLYGNPETNWGTSPVDQNATITIGSDPNATTITIMPHCESVTPTYTATFTCRPIDSIYNILLNEGYTDATMYADTSYSYSIPNLVYRDSFTPPTLERCQLLLSDSDRLWFTTPNPTIWVDSVRGTGSYTPGQSYNYGWQADETFSPSYGSMSPTLTYSCVAGNIKHRETISFAERKNVAIKTYDEVGCAVPEHATSFNSWKVGQSNYCNSLYSLSDQELQPGSLVDQGYTEYPACAHTVYVQWNCEAGYTYDSATGTCVANTYTVTYKCWSGDSMGQVDADVALFNYEVKDISWYGDCVINQNLGDDVGGGSFEVWKFSGDNSYWPNGDSWTIPEWQWDNDKYFVPAYPAKFDCDTSYWQAPRNGAPSDIITVLGENMTMPAMNCEPKTDYVGWISADNNKWISKTITGYEQSLATPVTGMECPARDIILDPESDYTWACPTDLLFTPNDELIEKEITVSCGENSTNQHTFTMNYDTQSSIKEEIISWFHDYCGGKCHDPEDTNHQGYSVKKVCAGDWGNNTIPSTWTSIDTGSCYITEDRTSDILDAIISMNISGFNITGIGYCPKYVNYKCSDGAEYSVYREPPYAVYDKSYTPLTHTAARCESGFVFDKWKVEGENGYYNENVNVDNWPYNTEITLVAQWGNTGNVYNIHYENMDQATPQPPATGMPTTYTYGVGATINATPSRQYSEFLGWCKDARLTDCDSTQTISTDDMGNKTFWAKWECVSPYHMTQNGQCEPCKDPNTYWDEGTQQCLGCPDEFPRSLPPYNWSIDQCYRPCSNGATCNNSVGSVLNGLSSSASYTLFPEGNNSSKQIEFKGNVEAEVDSCDASEVPYCAVGVVTTSAAAYKPVSEQVDFHGMDDETLGNRYIFGTRTGDSGVNMGNADAWCQIVGPAQKYTVGAYTHTHILYPADTAPNAEVSGYEFKGYYNPRQNGTRYIESNYTLGAANAERVRSGISGNLNTPRDLYAQYDQRHFTITYKPNYTGATESDQTQDVVYGRQFRTYGAIFHRTGHIMTNWGDCDPMTQMAAPYPLLNHTYIYLDGGDVPLCAVWKMCEQGTQPNADGTECVLCEDNEMWEDGVCKPCDDGEQPNEAGTACVPCPEGTAGTNGTCEPCPDGTQPNATYTACVPCQAGTYGTGGTCEPCSEGYSSAPGSTSISDCFLTECPDGQHLNHGWCDQDEVSCDAPYATIATRTWNERLNAYGSCKIIECEEGYHIASNACVPDDGECVVANGRGTREWNGTAWTTCEIIQCDSGYTVNNAGTACERCPNYLGYDGQQAVSSYITGCEIASCMYQGQKYALINGECEPICETTTDDTGSKRWDNNLRKCVRTCNLGYKMW